MQITLSFKRFILFFLVVIAFNANISNTSAQMVKQPVWEYKFSKTEAGVGDVIEIVLTTTAPKDWYIYSTNVECEIGPIKAVFNFEKNNTYELVGELYSVGDKKFIDDVFNCPVGKFEKKAELRQKIKILSPKLLVKGFLEGQMCSNVTGMCVPLETSDITFSGITITGNAISGSNDEKATSNNNSQNENINNSVSTDSSQNTHQDTANDSVKNMTVSTDINKESYTPSYLYKAKDENDIGRCEVKKYESEVVGVSKDSLFGFFLLAFLSGLAALLTPCVFPMIPMTVAFFMKGGESKSKAQSIRSGLLFGASIIFIYTVLGSFVGVVFGEDAANFVATHWIPNIFFFLVFIFFAAAFFGAFELVLPSWLVNKVDKQSDKGGFVGIFFMALTLALVSFSCTGPIVGIVLVESLNGEFVKPVLGMFGFSLAFALPFALFAMFPTWLNSLPKSGGWLNSVKVVLGFLELALGLKFLSLADQTYHWGILDREVYLALWIIIFTLMGLYLLGKLKFAHDTDLPYLKVPRLILAIITFSFVVYLIPGMFGAPLKALAGYLPPMSTHDFAILEKLEGERGDVEGTPKYSDKLHLPHNLKGYFDYEEGMAYAKKVNKPVFIDFTGHGCVNCREMEARVWSDERVLDILSKDYIIIALYVDDKTISLPEDEQYLSKITGRKVTTLGKKNSDIQSCMFGSNSQPNYILLDNDENLLNSPQPYDLSVENFIRFLKQGVKHYKENQSIKAKQANPVFESAD
ncbi:MAG: thioredoxin family protein [Bacteroidetes bacterium]|nr:thioredoxin family protein [Bacteroidota bacterium]